MIAIARIILFLLAFGSVVLTGAADRPFYQACERRGIKMELWLESEEPSWDAISVCCSLTNTQRAPNLVGIRDGNVGPYLYLDVKDQSGKQVSRAEIDEANGLFMIRGEVPTSGIGTRLLAGESMVMRIPIKKALVMPDPSNATVTAIWGDREFEGTCNIDNHFKGTIRHETLTATITLPPTPIVIPKDNFHMKVFTPRELYDRDAGGETELLIAQQRRPYLWFTLVAALVASAGLLRLLLKKNLPGPRAGVLFTSTPALPPPPEDDQHTTQ